MPKSLGWYKPEQLILKITLQESKPSIWRRVEVHSGLTLDDLHHVIQKCFDWDNSHLYQFLVTPDGKLTRTSMREATRYHALPSDPVNSPEEDDDMRSDNAIIGYIFTPDRKEILYEYDFGNGWNHIVKIEKRTPGGDMDHTPECLAGENAAPRDDMGGIHGYYQWLEAIANPKHEMHEQAVEWLGKDFQPAAFDLKVNNKRLAKLFVSAPKKKPSKPKKKA